MSYWDRIILAGKLNRSRKKLGPEANQVLFGKKESRMNTEA